MGIAITVVAGILLGVLSTVGIYQAAQPPEKAPTSQLVDYGAR